MHHTKDKGDLGVFAAELDLARKGFQILVPRTEHAPFDLVAYDGTRYFRIQVKFRAAVEGTLRLRFSSSWADRRGTHTRFMDKSLVDIVCVYCPDTDSCYYLDPKEFGVSAQLRLAPARSGQEKGTRPADQFREFPGKSVRVASEKTRSDEPSPADEAGEGTWRAQQGSNLRPTD
ncbi:MAG TPA: group I intron-associated PD-(D/E)XK endonuclease [bacterium]|nr:group I intron-associated PD-(D/E)XK endonuclease [bacterium]